VVGIIQATGLLVRVFALTAKISKPSLGILFLEGSTLARGMRTYGRLLLCGLGRARMRLVGGRDGMAVLLFVRHRSHLLYRCWSVECRRASSGLDRWSDCLARADL